VKREELPVMKEGSSFQVGERGGGIYASLSADFWGRREEKTICEKFITPASQGIVDRKEPCVPT